ncbi:conserved hypothetical protein [Candidatus Koribacter versatilis Ellin345]|uniref:Phage baseplate protein n=2 Tax=Candidatus Korobacter versatilis TaxID=658062 RepID=Q1ITD4_KORVE|nr:conserved hypothetical protein [Candidatus Koribacter versatilis Ellin345]
MHPLDRGVMTLAAVAPEVASADIADWPLGRRNQALLETHIVTFGPQLQGWSVCSECDEKMEFEIDARVLLSEQQSVRTGRISFRDRVFRLPTSRDLAALQTEDDPNDAALALVQRCLSEGESVEQWRVEDTEPLGEAMAQADPMAEVRISFVCPKCENHSEETIDLVNFLWSEIEARAKRALWEVHAIASAYGWSEGEILSLSATRRANYMEMVHA